MNNRVMKDQETELQLSSEQESDVKYIKKVQTVKTAKVTDSTKPATQASAQNTGAKVYGSPCLPQYSD